MSLLKVIEGCDNFYSDETYSLLLEDNKTKVGLLTLDVVQLFKTYIQFENNKDFVLVEGTKAIRFNDQVNSLEKRTEAIAKLVTKWQKEDSLVCLRGWRNEIYPVYYTKHSFNDSVAFTLERAASWAFGVATFGVHINGYTETDNGINLWVAKRSPTKQTWPNKLDNTCAGGISYGMSIYETMIKECEEEGSVPKTISSKAKSVGLVTYVNFSVNGISPETQYIYDLKFPADFIPKPNDGEVSNFYLMSVDEVLKALHDDEFKPNCVVVDFLIRQGIINRDNEPNLHEIMARCHRLLPFN